MEKVLTGLLLVVFGGVVIHAPLSVGLGVLFPDYDLIVKAWKEILLGVATLLFIIVVTRRRAWGMLKTPLIMLISVYTGLHLAVLPFFHVGTQSMLAGLLIDLRYLLFFVLVYGTVSLYPSYRRLFITVFFAGAGLVVAFAALQVTVLPHDFLSYLGYSRETIAPYLTVDQNMDYIRINSTLRGPNPLGAYAGIVMALTVSLWLFLRQKLSRRSHTLLGALFVLATSALWFSYSRSALVAGIVAVGVVFLVRYGRRFSKGLLVALALVSLGTIGGVYALRDTSFVSHVILHEDPTEGNNVNSNDGHVESLADGVSRMLRQPFGAGVGSTGSASLLGDSPLIIENHYLFIAHEVGWLGLGTFLALSVVVLRDLWRRRNDWLALGVFASGVGLALIGILLPVWSDDTVSLVWWGLVAVALATSFKQKSRSKLHNI